MDAAVIYSQTDAIKAKTAEVSTLAAVAAEEKAPKANNYIREKKSQTAVGKKAVIKNVKEFNAATTEVFHKEEEAEIAKNAATAKDQEVFEAMTDVQKDAAATEAIAETATKQTAAVTAMSNEADKIEKPVIAQKEHDHAEVEVEET